MNFFVSIAKRQSVIFRELQMVFLDLSVPDIVLADNILWKSGKFELNLIINRDQSGLGSSLIWSQKDTN